MKRLTAWPAVMIGLMTLILLIGAGVAYAVTYGGDVTSTSNAISDSSAAGQPNTNTFDDNTGTYWETATVAANCVSSVAYVGQNFGTGVTKDVRRIWVHMVATSRGITSAIVQYSDNGSSWISAETVSLVNDGSNHSYDIAEHSGHQWWRLVCNSVPSGAWRVYEIEMDEILTDTPTPTTAPPTSTITPTPSSTPSPTPDYSYRITETSGAPAKLERSATFGDLQIFGGLVAIFFVLVLILAVLVWKRG